MKRMYKKENLTKIVKQEPFIDIEEKEDDTYIQFCLGKSKKDIIESLKKIKKISEKY